MAGMIEGKRRTRGGAFARGFLSGIAATGLLYPAKFAPRRYERSNEDDLKAIGADMWKAFGRVRTEKGEKADAA